jgi:hypothetical protein
MRAACRFLGRAVVAGLLLGLSSPLSGCDSSKQSGTMVQVDEEQKAQLSKKREMYSDRAKEKPKSTKKR